jgi:predicted nucleotidyltransferase component of viral defense system
LKRKPIQNLAASVHARLLRRTELGNEDFQFVLMRYGVERLMYRLSQSEHAADFVLKGALLFLVWAGAPYRVTKDMDLLALKSASVERLRDIFQALCELAVTEDGLVFEPQSVRAEEIREDNLYQGVRVTLLARLGKARVPIQVDIGFGDAVTPTPVQMSFPTLLDFPAPHLAMYPRETVVAEKFEAMVKLGLANSRMKDFYDIWALSRECDFDGGVRSAAIQATFKRRKTAPTPTMPLALTSEFSRHPSKQTQWKAFVGLSRLRLAGEGLERVVAEIRKFMEAPVVAASKEESLKAVWAKGGPWRPL